jgi:hypothetical protein
METREREVGQPSYAQIARSTSALEPLPRRRSIAAALPSSTLCPVRKKEDAKWAISLPYWIFAGSTGRIPVTHKNSPDNPIAFAWDTPKTQRNRSEHWVLLPLQAGNERAARTKSGLERMLRWPVLGAFENRYTIDQILQPSNGFPNSRRLKPSSDRT